MRADRWAGRELSRRLHRVYDSAPVPEDLTRSVLARANQPTGRPSPGRQHARRWLLVPAAAVAVAAIVVLAVILVPRAGNGTGGGTVPTAGSPSGASTTSGSPTTTSRPATTSTDSTAGSPTTRPVGSTTILGAGPVLGRGEGTGWTLYAFGSGTEGRSAAVARVDLGTGVQAVSTVPTLSSNGPLWLIAGPAGVIVRPIDYVSGYRVTSDGAVTQLTGALALAMALPGPKSGQLWVESPARGTTASRTFALTDFTGKPLGPTISLPSADGIPEPDGAGGLLVQTDLGAWDVTPTGRTLIVPPATPHTEPSQRAGQIIGASAGGYLLSSCLDLSSQCELRSLSRSGALGPAVQQPAAAGWTTAGLLAPDGRHALVQVEPSTGGSTTGATGKPLYLLADLQTGRSSVLPISPADSSMGLAAVWSPDSKWLIVASPDGSVTAISTDGKTTLSIPVPIDATLLTIARS